MLPTLTEPVLISFKNLVLLSLRRTFQFSKASEEHVNGLNVAEMSNLAAGS